MQVVFAVAGVALARQFTPPIAMRMNSSTVRDHTFFATPHYLSAVPPRQTTLAQCVSESYVTLRFAVRRRARMHAA